MARTLNLVKKATRLVIDHHQVNHAPQTVNIHYLEVAADDTVIRGDDCDGVTVEELGGSKGADITTLITGPKLVAFITKLSEGLPTTLDVLPPPVEEKAEAKEAATA